MGAWNFGTLEPGIWNLEFGIWNLELKTNIYKPFKF
jgi:hypothetical protein